MPEINIGPRPEKSEPAPEAPPGIVEIGPPPATMKPEFFSFRSKLTNGNPQEVTIAVEGLVKLGGPDAVTALWELYNHGPAAQRIQAIHAIGQIRQKSDAEYLFRVAVGDMFQAVRFAAAEELAKLEGADKAVQRLSAEMTPERKMIPLFRMRALYAIAHIGGPAALKALTPWLDAKFGDLATAAAEGLGMLNDPGAIDPLFKALASTDDEFKPCVADALEQASGQNFRFDLVKWTQWIKEQKEPPVPKDVSPSTEAAVKFPVPKPPAYPPVDIVVIFDTTGSMLHIWPQVSAVIDSILGELVKQSNSLRVATIKYRASRLRDMSKYLIEPKPFTRKVQAMRDDIMDASFGGGSGGLHLGLRHALGALSWRSQSRKIVLVIGDTTPNDEGLAACMQMIQDAWSADGVLVSTLFVRNLHGEEHRATYRMLSQAGGGRFYEYNKAEKHVVDLMQEKIDVKHTELPAETARKLLTSRKNDPPAKP